MMMEELMEGTMHMMEKFSSNLENAPIASPSKKKSKSKAKAKNSVTNTNRAHQKEPLSEPYLTPTKVYAFLLSFFCTDY